MNKRAFKTRYFAGCLALSLLVFVPLQAQERSQSIPEASAAGRDYREQRDAWFYRGRVVRGVATGELRRRAYQTKLAQRKQRAALAQGSGQISYSNGSWTALGPVPLASDASGNGTQDYGAVAGRATAIAIDPADVSGNTVYIGGAQGGIWKSTNAGNNDAGTVLWSAIADSQATLSIGSIAIQPGNSDPNKSVILAATGEANDSADSYFGLGILRSADGGSSWSLIGSANAGLSFSGLGGTRMAFSAAANQAGLVVSAMATSSEGVVSGKVTSSTKPGLYTSTDAGLSWAYDVLSDGTASADATSATSVVYDSTAGRFLAAVRYHGFYSSSDGVTWTRLTNQPGGSVLSVTACPAVSSSNNRACPIFRGELTVVPGREEVYAWYISLDGNGNAVDRFIWKSTDGGNSWSATPISNWGIAHCGDSFGCGVEQGDYNLELLAVPYGDVTDLYAGALNVYKCTISSQNPTCASEPFKNLTHVFGCAPIAAPAHVHPSQHALAFAIPSSGNALMYFANDGGIYRALDGFTGLDSGLCSGVNAFDNLNQDLGSLTQFVSVSVHPNDPNTLLGGTQGNGSPATSQATTNSSWWNVLGGDGGYNAIDPLVGSNFYASNPDVPPGGLGIQFCTNGVNCHTGDFDFVVTSSTLAGDDGGFNFPFILDPGGTSTMLVGTCRIWRGPRAGGSYTALSPNFDTLGSGGCLGNEVNQVRAIAAAGMPDSYGSSIIYATTNGLGPIDGPLNSPSGGRVWVTTNATGGSSYFTDVTNHGPQGSINPNQFPISGVATDSSYANGKTAYVTIMGFTGGPGHVWQTTDAGVSWTDFTANLPDSPVNAVLVYQQQVFVATDVGVFASPTSSPSWTELGPTPSSGFPGYLPNVAVTALSIFHYGSQQLLRAATYGRGIWEFNLVITPDYRLATPSAPLAIFASESGTLNGTVTALNGYVNSVTLSCAAGPTAPPSTCTLSPGSLIPGNKTPFTVNIGGTPRDYSFNVQGTGSDASHLVRTTPVSVRIIDYGMSSASPSSVTVTRGTTTPAVAFQVTAAGSFSQVVNVSCISDIPQAICTLNPGNAVYPRSGTPVQMNATIDVPGNTATGTYTVNLEANTEGAPSTRSTSFTVVVTSNSDFVLKGPDSFPNVKVATNGTSGAISITSQDGFAGTVTLSCPATYGAGSCSIAPATVSSFPAVATLTINGNSFAAGSYSLSITGTSGAIVHSVPVAFDVGDYSISGTQALSGVPGGQVQGTFKLTSDYSYSGIISATCDASALAGAICSLSSSDAMTLASGGSQSFTANISVPNSAIPGVFKLQIKTQDTAGAPAHSTTLSLTVAQDFVVTSSTPSQTVIAGQTSGPFALTVQPVGTSFTGAVTLACTKGLPAGAGCAFSPSTPVTPGASAVNVVMSISTSKSAKSAARLGGRGMGLIYALCLVPAFVMGGAFSRRRISASAWICGIAAWCLLSVLCSCGGVSSGGSGGGGGSGNPVNYQITVTGASLGTAPDSGQSTVVTLVVD